MAIKRGISDIIREIKNTGDEFVSDDMIEIHSDKLALISGCVRITEYSSEKLSLSFRNKTVTLYGSRLEPESLINGQMAVKGTIRGVTYGDN